MTLPTLIWRYKIQISLDGRRSAKRAGSNELLGMLETYTVGNRQASDLA